MVNFQIQIMKSFFLFLFLSNAFTLLINAQPKKFTEGIVYSRTSFPGHPLNDSLKKLDYESGDFLEQYGVIQDLKKHQKSIKEQDEQGIKDAFFVSGIMVMPAYSKMYFTPTKTLIKTDALGYHQEVLINSENHTGKLVLADRDKTNQGTINFHTDDMQEVWQKYKVDAAQYSIQKTAETAVIAGYLCKKIIYTFGGTSRGTGVSNYIINMLPLKVTAWYSDDLPPSINLMHTLDFELQKAVLKFEVEYDKNKKNKMLVEVTKLAPQKIEEDKFDLAERAPVVEHKKKGYESGMMIMQVMMNAIALLTK
jgi:hypothetical protein